MKNLLSISVITLLIISFFVVFSQNDMRAQYESGKWVPEYGGGTVPTRCACVKNVMRSACRVGDLTTNLSLCNGPDTTDPGKGDVNF